MLDRQLTEDASAKYRVGTGISAILKPKAKDCAMTSLSKTNLSEFNKKGIVSSSRRL